MILMSSGQQEDTTTTDDTSRARTITHTQNGAQKSHAFGETDKRYIYD